MLGSSLFRAVIILSVVRAALPGVNALCAEADLSSFNAQAGPAYSTAIVNADFDGDNRPDLAIASSRGFGYTIEIQFSTPLAKTYLNLANSGIGIRIFAYDIDRDSYQDLVVTSAASLLPIAVYLGDGKGHFQEAKPWSFLPIVLFETPYRYEPGSDSTSTVSLLPQSRFVLDGASAVAVMRQEAWDLVPPNLNEVPPWRSAKSPRPRSPPPSSSL